MWAGCSMVVFAVQVRWSRSEYFREQKVTLEGMLLVSTELDSHAPPPNSRLSVAA